MENEEVIDDKDGITRLANWRKYQAATGYYVDVTVTYTRTRKVRAESKEQAKEFAVERETRSADKAHTDSGNGIKYSVSSVRAGDVRHVPEKEKKDG